MSRTNYLSATNLAVHHHLNCDLYLHNSYHEERTAGTRGQDKPLSELSKAQFKRGLDWESTLYSWLDRSELLLKVPCIPLEAKTLVENIQADDRDHFFITGLTFWPPEAQLNERFLKASSVPVNFGLAKPDLLEITRTSDGVTWKVVDAKASKSVKTSHHVQIYFYTLCLSYILDDPFFTPSGEAGVWLPPKQGFHSVLPSFEDVKTIDILLLESSLNYFLFSRLPSLLSLSLEDVSWHFNPLCRGCNYETQCRSRATNEGEIGSAPNISIDDARSLKDLLQISFSTSLLSEHDRLTDIEDLHTLIAKPGALDILDRSSPSLTKKARRVLGLPRKRRVVKSSAFSPVIQAARSNKIQVIPRRNFTCPSEEDVAFVISLILDPSSPGTNVEFFCITAVSSITLEMPTVTHGTDASLIAALARYIRTILTLTPIPRTQFYVWSAIEQASLQSYLINAALISVNDADVRLCIGALAQGASLLQTAFQPLLLSGALLSFLSKGKMLKADYQACLERMDLSTTGKFEELRQRLDDEIRKIQLEGESLFENDDHRREFGQLPRVVVLKKEVESLLALPTPGYWELPDCARVLLTGDSSLPPSSCPSDEEIFRLYKMESSLEPLQGSLLQRNDYIYAVLIALRSRVASHDGLFLLVNEAKVLSSKFMDLCRQDTLRKLFFMQQFEVLSKLNELWKSRIDGCPDAPVLEYRTTTQGAKGIIHVFRLVSGTVDIRGDKDQAFYDHILVEDVSEDSDSDKEIPVEALFDDLAVSGLLFPLNRYTKANWQLQHPTVQRKLAVVDLKNVTVQGDATTVSLHIWGTWEVGFDRGRHYRLSPRLVDFNTAKSLAALFELDLQCSTHQENPSPGLQMHHDLPFLQLILDPKSFGAIEDASQYLRIENDMQRLFRDLRDLGNTSAGALVLKSSQHRAARRILSNRLSVIWGPPGTGKTYTISLSLLRLLEVQRRLGDRSRKIVFITAMTHAAIDACRNKLLRLIDHYQDIESLPTQWLSELKIEQVLKGNDHPAPPKSGSGIRVYTGTIYQLYNFTKRFKLDVDCVIVDEAGQIPLASLPLVLRSLVPSGRIVIAGDSEQLAPILSAQYPQLNTGLLFGSVLDCIMHKQVYSEIETRLPTLSPSDDYELSSSHGTIVQLTENFRLNPDLGEFVSTIYSRQFKPQKVQARQIGTALKRVELDIGKDFGLPTDILQAVQSFLVSLSNVMSRKPQTSLSPPTASHSVPSLSQERSSDFTLTHYPVSLSLIRLQTWSQRSQHFGYEMHVRGEAAVAASLVASIRRCCPTEGIFVATPHRIQREAVRTAISRINLEEGSLDAAFSRLHVNDVEEGRVTVDTIERLQGSEAAFVICLFSIPKSFESDLGFLLERRRLNVAISRAKTLCILITSEEVLRPSVKILANEETAKGYAFLKAFEDRAWSYELNVDLDKL